MTDHVTVPAALLVLVDTTLTGVRDFLRDEIDPTASAVSALDEVRDAIAPYLLEDTRQQEDSDDVRRRARLRLVASRLRDDVAHTGAADLDAAVNMAYEDPGMDEVEAFAADIDAITATPSRPADVNPEAVERVRQVLVYAENGVLPWALARVYAPTPDADGRLGDERDQGYREYCFRGDLAVALAPLIT